RALDAASAALHVGRAGEVRGAGLVRFGRRDHGTAFARARARVVECEPVAVDDLDAARPAANLVGADTRQSLCEHVPVGRLELNGVTGRERALAAHDTDCEETATVHEQRAVRALVDNEATDGWLRISKPE